MAQASGGYFLFADTPLLKLYLSFLLAVPIETGREVSYLIQLPVILFIPLRAEVSIDSGFRSR